jgi:PAS domain S-box-containing protein
MQDYEHELAVIKKLLKKNPGGMSVTDIARALKKNKNTVGRYLDILLISGQVDMRTYGMAKVFTLSQRVPLSAMLSYSKELIMVLDSDSRIVDLNDNFLHLLQLERTEAIGKNIGYVSPPDIDGHDLLESIAAGEGREGEDMVTFHRKEGGDRIFKVKRIPTVFEDGGKGVTVILEDITEHILAEREIRESEERFRMMADNIQDGLVILENGRSVYVNRRLAAITGYSFEELWKMDPLTRIAPESRKEFAQKLKDLESLKSGPWEITAWIIKKGGERRFVHARFTILQHEEKTYTFVILTDLTELKEKEDELKESERRFRVMAENIRDGLVIVENNAIVFANRRMMEITGYTFDEMAQANFLEHLSDEKMPIPEIAGAVSTDGRYRLHEIMRNIRPGRQVPPGEATFWIRKKDGTQRCIQGSFSATENNGIVSIYITATDITTFAEKEKALRDRIASLQELVT